MAVLVIFDQNFSFEASYKQSPVQYGADHAKRLRLKTCKENKYYERIFSKIYITRYILSHRFRGRTQRFHFQPCLNQQICITGGNAGSIRGVYDCWQKVHFSLLSESDNSGSIPCFLISIVHYSSTVALLLF